jgi:hypothetical protein
MRCAGRIPMNLRWIACWAIVAMTLLATPGAGWATKVALRSEVEAACEHMNARGERCDLKIDQAGGESGCTDKVCFTCGDKYCSQSPTRPGSGSGSRATDGVLGVFTRDQGRPPPTPPACCARYPKCAPSCAPNKPILSPAHR